MNIQVSIEGAGTWTEELWEGMDQVSENAILEWATWNWGSDAKVTLIKGL
jgi:hypothetical protein